MNKTNFNIYLVALFGIFHQYLCSPSPSLQYINKINDGDVQDLGSNFFLGPTDQHFPIPSEKAEFLGKKQSQSSKNIGIQLASCFAARNPPPGFESPKLKVGISNSDYSSLKDQDLIYNRLAHNNVHTESRVQSEHGGFHASSSHYSENNWTPHHITQKGLGGPAITESKGFQKAVQPPKSPNSGFGQVLCNHKGYDMSEEKRKESNLGASSAMYKQWDDNARLNNMLSLEGLKMKDDTKVIYTPKIQHGPHHPGSFQLGPQNMLGMTKAPVGNQQGMELSVPLSYPVSREGQLRHITPDIEFDLNQGHTSHYIPVQLSRSQVSPHQKQLLHYLFIDYSPFSVYMNKTSSWTHHDCQASNTLGNHIWKTPQSQPSGTNPHEYHSFEPPKIVPYAPFVALENGPNGSLKGWNHQHEMYDHGLKITLELFEEIISDPYMENPFQDNWEGIYNFFAVLHQRLTQIIRKGNWNYWGMTADFKAFVVYAVKVPETFSQVKSQLLAWKLQRKPGSFLHNASEFALEWIDSQDHLERNNGIYPTRQLKKKIIKSKGLWKNGSASEKGPEAEGYDSSLRRWEMALNRSLKFWREFTAEQKPSRQHNFFGLTRDLQKTQVQIDKKIKDRSRKYDDWYFPGELADYVAFAARKEDISPVVKVDLKRWMSLSGDGNPISSLLQYTHLKELDYRKRLNTALNYWEDILHMPWQVQQNKIKHENFALNSFVQTDHDLHKRFSQNIRDKIDNDYMDKVFATYVASAFKCPKVFNRIKESLESWMKLTDKGSAMQFKAQVAASWLQEKQAGVVAGSP
ncbi:uncharacterized protein MELLADRAFT_64183 [Melampsora larici-populina 98AG31]|uniref:Secreted protein n=1 Tax=Melampsora larici-populina (strain 98AG31 / pathotype 3-4-7) TaxID=747676 RepID=F4RQB0_MELLP|nr:uncharacterized protein MELLADRAFT_64183 [Melampsora larici-populina 98AG31]EGG05436.1 hypothetical protein MELLADRAFT_64183 [Melampsora larici-populina 98AG31]